MTLDELNAAFVRVRRDGLPDASHLAEIANDVREVMSRGALSGERARVVVDVLRTATLEPMADGLVVDAAAHGVAVRSRFGSYAPLEAQAAQYAGESEGDERRVILVAPEWGDVCGGDGLAVAANERLAQVLRAIRSRTRAPVLVMLPSPDLTGCAASDWLDSNGPVAAARAVVAELSRVCDELADCYPLPPIALGSDSLWQGPSSRARDPRLWQTHRVPYGAAAMRTLAVRVSRALGALLLPRAKVLVLDADNTLWGGVLGEVGVEGVLLAPDGPGSGYRSLHREALALRDRGVVLALCSKNDEGLLLDALERHPHSLLRPRHFAAHAISWGNKAEGLRRIGDQLGLGLDSLVFVDDNPHECELVRQTLPQIEVHQLPTKPHQIPGFIGGLRAFDALRVLDADRAKSEQYEARAARGKAWMAAGLHAPSDKVPANIPSGSEAGEFLRSLGLSAKVCRPNPAILDRIAQMEQKTNQFNTTTLRLTRTDLESVLARGGAVFGLSLADRFGDHGVTVAGVVDAVEGDAVLWSFLVSCRVIGLGGEDGLLALAGEWAKARGCERLLIPIRETERNTPCRSFPARHGFSGRDTSAAMLAESWLSSRLHNLGGNVVWWERGVRELPTWPTHLSRTEISSDEAQP